MHFDLKSENVLLQDKNYLVAKVADLGMSRYVVEGRSLATVYGQGAPVSRHGLIAHAAHAR